MRVADSNVMSLLNKKIRLIREEPERKRDKEQTHRETDVRPLIVVSPRLKNSITSTLSTSAQYLLGFQV